VFGDYNVNW